MTDAVRCQETIASYAQDAGEPISYRALSVQVGGTSAVCAEALAQYYQANAKSIGALQLVIKQGANQTSSDPRSRVIKLSTTGGASLDAGAYVYGVYPSAEAVTADDLETVATTLWAQERKVRNELFSRQQKNTPLSREARVFCDSEIACEAATSRTDMGGARGEEAVSMFDTIGGATSRPQSQAKSSFFGSSVKATTSSTSTSSAPPSSTSTAKSNGFFKQSATSTSTAKPKAATPAKAASTKRATKRIDDTAMSNVLSVDSDSESDNDAPKFVKKTSAAASKPRAKRVMISDDEDEDFELVPPPAKKQPVAQTKANKTAPLDRSTESVSQSEASVASPKRKRSDADAQEDEPMAEDDTLPTGPIKRRKEVNRTYINDHGYMTTEKVIEEVEVSAEELMQERAEAAKKKKAAEAAAATPKARAAAAVQAASSSKPSKAPAGPAKQKKLDFFFARK